MKCLIKHLLRLTAMRIRGTGAMTVIRDRFEGGLRSDRLVGCGRAAGLHR